MSFLKILGCIFFDHKPDTSIWQALEWKQVPFDSSDKLIPSTVVLLRRCLRCEALIFVDGKADISEGKPDEI